MNVFTTLSTTVTKMSIIITIHTCQTSYGTNLWINLDFSMLLLFHFDSYTVLLINYERERSQRQF